MATLVLSPISDVPSESPSHAEHVQHFQDQGLSSEVSEALYMALRLQDKGQTKQAVMYYTAVLQVAPACALAKMNLNMLIALNDPKVFQTIAAAVDEEQARRAAEEEEAKRMAAEAAAEECRRAAEEEERRKAAARAEQERRQAAVRAEEHAKEERRRAEAHAKEERRRAEAFAREERRRAADNDLYKLLSQQFPGMQLNKVRFQDIRRGEAGTLVCRSTFSSAGKGIGWDGYSYTAGSSGRVYDSRGAAPQPCFNCDGDHFRRFCPYGQW